jgi:hypothetical protein
MWRREYTKWEQFVYKCEHFVDVPSNESSAEDNLLEAREWQEFWAEADRELGRRKRKNSSTPETIALDQMMQELDRRQLRVRLARMSDILEEQLGIDADPLGAESKDVRILARLAAGDEIVEEDVDRHVLLLKFSESYQMVFGTHRRQTSNTNMGSERLDSLRPHRAQTLLKQWEADGLDVRQTLKNLGTLSGEESHLPPPEPRLIRSPRDAELVAVDWMRFWGFDDAQATPVGADEGIDVVSAEAVVQVKAHMVPIGRPELQNLAGVAAVEDKIAVFFALTGYTAQAIEWGTKAKMALFTFDLQGLPEPVNDIARKFGS